LVFIVQSIEKMHGETLKFKKKLVNEGSRRYIFFIF